MVQYSKDRREDTVKFSFLFPSILPTLTLDASKGGEIHRHDLQLVVDHSTGWGPQPVPLLITMWRVYTITGHMLLRHVTQFNGP